MAKLIPCNHGRTPLAADRAASAFENTSRLPALQHSCRAKLWAMPPLMNPQCFNGGASEVLRIALEEQMREKLGIDDPAEPL